MLTLYRNLFAPPRDLIPIIAAIWLGLILAEKRSDRHGISKEDLNNIVFYPLLGYVLGGRIMFAIENFSAFTQNPQSLISLNLDLFDPLGGIVVALLVALVYGQRKKLLLWPVLDALTPFFATFALGLGLAHLASGSAFGKETSLPWGIELWGAERHPSQFYEILAALLILGLLWFRDTDSKPGVHFLTFTALTSSARLFLEGFRGDSTLMLGGLRLAQVIAWIVLAVSFFLLDRAIRKPPEYSAIRR
ncbi:MAG: prolipoprotein diacylglyceryl transferase [Anaerolineales bacterium]|jgi:phosphatidylglycerol:prolipoprotein diacylglycerol transferase